ncbi:AP-1 complex subunit mu-1, partial [Desmophyllum pertusum]
MVQVVSEYFKELEEEENNLRDNFVKSFTNCGMTLVDFGYPQFTENKDLTRVNLDVIASFFSSRSVQIANVSLQYVKLAGSVKLKTVRDKAEGMPGATVTYVLAPVCSVTVQNLRMTRTISLHSSRWQRANSERRSTANNVEIHIPVPPDADTPKFKTTVGVVKYTPRGQRDCVEYEILP